MIVDELNQIKQEHQEKEIRKQARANRKRLPKRNILRSRGEKMSNNPYQRRAQVEERMQKASPKDLCLVIRDLNYRSHRGKLNNNDTRILKHAQSFLLAEWERSLGTLREQASREMDWILKENQARRPFFTI